MKKTVFFIPGLLAAALMFTLVLSSCENAEDLAQKGDAYFNLEEYEQAVTFYDKAIQKKPSAELYVNRAAAYYNLDNADAVIADLNAAINLDSNYSEAYLRRGSVYYEAGDYANAARDLEQYTQFDRNNADANDILEMCALQGKWQAISFDFLGQYIDLTSFPGNVMFKGSFSIEGNTYVMDNNGEITNGIIEMNEGNIVMDGTESSNEGSLIRQGDRLILSAIGMGMTITFQKR
jgi:tetratricopeptide (TPR) repeat protein